MCKNYNIGLDIGTNSVGWAVTDENYNILKFNKKNMWGVRLFDEGQTAETRRINRSTRRRLNRRRERINLLQRLLSEDIQKVDKEFYIRLKESFLHLEDRKDKNNKSNLFIDKGFLDKDYYNLYHTIYHLRKELIENPEKKDIRLVYLALHHIIKYRGNFLYEGQKLDNMASNILEKIQELIDEVQLLEIANINITPEQIREIIDDKSLSRQKKVELLSGDNKVYKNELKKIFSGILGLKIDLSQIFKDIVFDEKINFKFSDDDIEEKLGKISNILNDRYELIEIMQQIYNYYLIGDILNGEKSISFAKVASYEKYKHELKLLKKIVSHYDKKLYKDIFRNNDKKNINYEAYVKDKNKIPKDKSKTKSIKYYFYNKIKKFIESHMSDGYLLEDKSYILKEIEKDNFLVIQNIKENSAIPYQLHEEELIKILDNQGKYYETISKNKDKIVKLLNFRIPYYVGPLNRKSEFAWVERIKGMENEKIYPWNMDNVVNIDVSATKFIKKMTNKCTYLYEEDVLPRNSLLYCDYLYYNEINKIRVNGKKLSKSLKEDLKEKLFLTKKNVTEKDIANWYECYYQTTPGDCKIEGLQGDKKASASLESYIDFKNIFGKIDSSNIEMIERLIEWITVFTDKKIIDRKIKSEYPEIASNKEILNKILKLKYKGWGRLSKKLLNEIYVIDSYQNRLTIIDKLRNSDLNFMQIINDKKLGFDKKIKQENKLNDNTSITYKNLIEGLQGSPKIKRGVWQSIKIIEEISKIMRKHPNNIFIEFAREDSESKKTTTKKNKLEKIYSNLGKVNNSYENDNVRKLLKSKNTILETKKQQLYFMQLGKCMYTGEALEYDQLNLYEIDHIIYQSLLKDDSIDNLVLVKKSQNQNRSNQVMPVNFVSNDIKVWWKYLYEKGLMSAKKYNFLMKRQLNRYEEQNFINRQLVETRQISKHVTNILINCYEKEGTKIIPIKAGLVDNFRKQFNIYKIREINDYHHAKDAFIVSVLGNYILNRFPSLEKDFIYNEYKKYTNLNNNKNNKHGFIIGSMNHEYKKDNQVIWNKEEYIGKIKKQLNYKDCCITKRICENKGELFKCTINPKLNLNKKITNQIPIKNDLSVRKYGYYTGEQIAYSSIIEYKKGKKIKKSLVGVPIRYSNSIGNSKDKLKKYFEIKLNLKDVNIIKDKILKYQLFKNSDGIFYLASTKEWHNAKQLLLDKDSEEIIYKMLNDYYKKDISNEQLIYVYESIINKIETQYLIFNKIYEKLKTNKDIFVNLSIEDKIEVLKEILKLTTANGENANLKLIKGEEREGRINSKNMKVEETTFIYPSITGLFIREERY